MKRIEAQPYELSKRARTLVGRVLLLSGLLMIAAPHARAGATLVSLSETWTAEGLRIENPSAITYVPGSAGADETFFIADVSYGRNEKFIASRLVALGPDFEPAGHSIDLRSVTHEPTGLAYHPTRKTFFVTDDDEVELYEIDMDGRRIQTIDLSELGASDPEGVAIDVARDSLFIADGRAQRILEITTRGDLVRKFSVEDIPGFREAEGIAFDPRSGHLFVTTGKSGVLFELTRGGTVVSAFDLNVLGAQRPQGIALAPSKNSNETAGNLRVFVVDDVTKKHPRGRLLELALLRRPSSATFTTSLVGDVDGFGFDGTERDFAKGDLDHNGLLERGEQLPDSILGSSTPREDRGSSTDTMQVVLEGKPLAIDHTIDLRAGSTGAVPGVPVWARLTLLVGDARTRAGTRNVIRVDGHRVGEVVGSTQKKLKAGAIASTVIELAPAVLRELSDGKIRIEISRDPGTGSDDIMIDYSRLEVAIAR